MYKENNNITEPMNNFYMPEQLENFARAQQNINWNTNLYVNDRRYGQVNISENMATKQLSYMDMKNEP